MTASTPESSAAPSPAAAPAATPAATPQAATVATPQDTDAAKRADRTRGNRRGGRGRGGKTPSPNTAPSQAEVAPRAGDTARAPAPRNPALDRLAQLYPRHFGAEQPLPLKRGIYEDLVAAHPQELDAEALKEALSQHTRSTRYLTAVASGQPRHDLQGNVHEPMAPEHVHHALLEVFRRRARRAPHEDLRPKLRRRIAQAFEASGLSPAAYTALVRGRDEEANQLMDEALADASARQARGEALLRAFEASGQSVAAFADMYGLTEREAGRTLEQARQWRDAARAA
ncbi:MAG: ProQ/FinO family protein [Burkholderiales bacterium]|nr:ProQ/FinO family protein [Burkholderiales bacterium]